MGIVDATKNFKRPVPPKPVEPAPAPAPAAAAPAAAPVAQPVAQAAPAPAAPSLFDTQDPHQVATRLGQDTGPQALGEDAPVLTSRELEVLQLKQVDLSDGVVAAIVASQPDPAADDITADMSPEAKASFEQLPPDEQEQFAAEYREADAPTQAAMDHALEEGLASDLLKATPDERAKYVELHTQAAERGDSAKALREVDGLLADGELGSYLAVEGRAGPEEKDRLAQLLLDGTLREEDGAGKSSLDYLGEFASQPGDVTGDPAQVPRDVLINDVLNEIYFSTASQPEGDRNCAPIQVIGGFAEKHPASFARVMTELAETGQTTVGHGGNTEILTYSGPPRVDSGGLSTAQQIFVEAFARPVDQENAREGGGWLGRAIGGLLDAFDGMNADEVAQMSERIAAADGEGADYEAMTVPTGDEIEDTPEARAEAEQLKAKAEQTIDEQLAAGEQPTVWMEGEDGQGHWVRVMGLIEIGPFKVYRYDDGTGMKLSTADGFMGKVGAVVYNTESSDVPAGSYNSKWDDPGAGLKPGQGIGGND